MIPTHANVKKDRIVPDRFRYSHTPDLSTTLSMAFRCEPVAPPDSSSTAVNTALGQPLKIP